MALQNFVDKVGPVFSAAWANAVDVLKVTVFADAATKAQARAALTSDAPMSVGQGGTGATTAVAALAALGGASTGLATASGLTQTTGKLLGRTTAGTGAVEEITVGTDLSLAAGALGVSSATEVLAGKVELATTAEAIAGTDTTRAVTAAGVKAAVAAQVGLLFLESITATAATTKTFATVLVPGTRYLVKGNVTVSSTDIMAARFNADSGANYGVVQNVTDQTGANAPAASSGSTQIIISSGGAAGDFVDFSIEIVTQIGDNKKVMLDSNSKRINAARTAFNRFSGAGFYAGAADLSSLTIFNYNAAGTFTGDLHLYKYAT